MYYEPRNVHEIIYTMTAQSFLFAFEVWQQAHSELCNCFRNKEGEQKDKPECISYLISIPYAIIYQKNLFKTILNTIHDAF
jgi:hypothetical protein